MIAATPATTTCCQVCRQRVMPEENWDCGLETSGIDRGVVVWRNEVEGAIRGVSGAAAASGMKAPLAPIIVTNCGGADAGGGAEATMDSGALVSMGLSAGEISAAGRSAVTGLVATGVPHEERRRGGVGSGRVLAIRFGLALGCELARSTGRLNHTGSSASATAIGVFDSSAAGSSNKT